MRPFVHLHVHSYFSILDGQASVQELVDLARADGMRGIALTDHGSMFGIKEFVNYVDKINKGVKSKIKELEAALADAPDDEKSKIEEQIAKTKKEIFTPIIGCECYCARRGRHMKETEKLDRSGYHLIVLAKNLTGYKNLIKMVSKSYTEGLYYRPRIDKELLEEHHEGLIISSACLGGEIPQLIMKGDYDGAKQSVLWFKSIFGDDYYLELQRHKATVPRANHETYEEQMRVNEQLIKLAKETGVKVVATNDVHFAKEEDAETHDRLICMNTKVYYDDPNRLYYSKQEWLKSQADMNRIFADIPEALDSTIEILNKIEHYSIDNKPLMPDFPIPEGFDGEDDYLRHLSYEGAKKRYGGELSHVVTERLDFELGTIKKMGFPGYFLIVQDFIAAAREMGVSVGPGRGSAAGSLVAYALGITNLDPIKYDLLFERFLNPDRISLPDIDIDFDDDGRLEVINWVSEKYGYEKVAHIITYGTMASKSAIKDVARVVRLPLPDSNRLAKLIPDKLPNVKKINIETAIKNVPELNEIYNGVDKVKRETLDFAMRLEGTVRSTGVHACGIIIGKDEISDTVPIFVTRDSLTNEEILVTQYEGKVIEQTGLIKMDFLGLKTLSIIKETLINIKKRHGISIDIEAIPLDDKKTYELFCDGRTSAVFQFESAGMQKYLMQLKPSKFEDLIAMNALYRPGPMDYIPSFVNRKHGLEPIHYDLPVMERFLKDTYGITVFQEQVMLLSRELADFTRGESDTLRKAMGKKDLPTMASLQSKFIAGGIAKGHPEDVLQKIWGDWTKFAEYAFNKSHSTCYSWIAYQTAYLKANYPAEFLAGVLSRNVNNSTEVTKYIDECRGIGIEVLCPDVNESDYIFTVNTNGNIRFGLGAIKGISKSAVNNIVEEREKNGQYKNVYDFFERINPNQCTKKVIESLVLSGAFDSFGDFSREDYFSTEDHKDEAFIDKLLKYALKTQNEKNSAQVSLFGESEYQEMAKPVLDKRAQPWSDIERLSKEKELLGIYLTSSPLEKYSLVLQYHCNATMENLSDLSGFVGRDMVFGGIVTGYRDAVTRKGAQCGFIRIQDMSGDGELALFGQNYAKFSNYGKEGLYLLFRATVEKSRSDERYFMTIQSCQLLEEVYGDLLKNLSIDVPYYAMTDELYSELVPDLLKADEGGIDITISVLDPTSGVVLKLESDRLKGRSIPPTFIEKLEQLEDISFELN
ncbi:DNA polymerase III subunit alpha [Porphyromonas sp.]|uniref:DNA polymerase III subunit alpha n=1 Tax=Porphyromonas sp. TaxID=1924944 RepID=UPI0026DCAE36|nr:DNA polymerase III subunit alpha [Porphyromonas sp.]MDO4695666.1 DNA polymerase III subunit alpha [Porphyromonas sp.]MDO4771654.1 DNA polymerase III subunit alpha [Porphyromonas sp.]